MGKKRRTLQRCAHVEERGRGTKTQQERRYLNAKKIRTKLLTLKVTPPPLEPLHTSGHTQDRWITLQAHVCVRVCAVHSGLPTSRGTCVFSSVFAPRHCHLRPSPSRSLVVYVSVSSQVEWLLFASSASTYSRFMLAVRSSSATLPAPFISATAFLPLFFLFRRRHGVRD